MSSQKRFSIVVPVYNAEKYLKACIQSVVNQSIGFEENVELVLVNDGSPDNSHVICEDYAQRYPNNVVYIHQENAGVSAARNAGVNAASGQIIGFVDADDKISLKTLEMVNNYFRITLDTVDVAIIPVTNFGARDFPYYLNGKFDAGTRTLDLNDPEWNYVCVRVGQAFIRSEAAKAQAFDSSITFYEDTKYINEIACEKMRMGLVTGCEYYYRRYPQEADSATSITAGAESNPRLYLETPVKVILHFLERYENDQDTPLYFQYMALCEMRWRTFYTQNRTADFLSSAQYDEYEAINDRIFRHISNHAILTAGQYAPWQKLYLLNAKHKRDMLAECTIDDSQRISLDGEVLFDPANTQILIYGVTPKEGCVELQGYVHAIQHQAMEYFINANDKKIPLEYQRETLISSEYPLDHTPYGYKTFRMSIPLPEDKTTVTFGLEVAGVNVPLKTVSLSKRGDISNVIKPISFCDHYIVDRAGTRFTFVKSTPENVAAYKARQKAAAKPAAPAAKPAAPAAKPAAAAPKAEAPAGKEQPSLLQKLQNKLLSKK